MKTLTQLTRQVGDPVKICNGDRYSGSRGTVADLVPSFGGIYRIRITRAREWGEAPKTIKPGDLLLVFPSELRSDSD